MPSTRPYDNSQRAEAAQATADAIVSALCELLVDERPDRVSIPAVAKRAGVSVRTVYSHFPTKGDLFEAINPWVKRTQLDPKGQTWLYDADLPMAELARQAVPSLLRIMPLSLALVRAGIDDDDHARTRLVERRDLIAERLRTDLPDLDDQARLRLAGVYEAVASWPVVRRLQQVDETDEGIADLLGWIIDTLVERAAATGTVG